MNSSVAIIVEGKSDKCFFGAYLKHLGFGAITDDIKAKDGILLRPSDGVEATFGRKFLPTLEEICKVRSKVLVIGDANSSPDGRRKKFWQSVEKITQEEKVNKDIIFSLFLLPDDSRQGELENLLEDISTKKDIYNCLGEYEDCLLKKNPKYCLLSLKDKIYAYCQAMGVEPRDEERDYADKRLWDLDSEKLNALKDFLQSNI